VRARRTQAARERRRFHIMNALTLAMIGGAILLAVVYDLFALGIL